MPILTTLFRALFWVALPVIGAACAGVYCSEHTRRDLAQEAAQKAVKKASQEIARELPIEEKQLVASGAHAPDA